MTKLYLHHHHGACAVLAVAAALLPQPAAAQPGVAGRSARPDYVRLGDAADPEEVLKQLLQQAAQRRKLQEILEQIQKNPNQFPIDLEQVKKLQNSDDPKIKKQIADFAKILEKQVLPGLDPKKAEDWRNALSKLKPPTGKTNGGNGDPTGVPKDKSGMPPPAGATGGPAPPRT